LARRADGVQVVITSSVFLREDQHAFAKALVDAGRFSTVSAVLQQGLVLLQQRANGSFISAYQLLARLAQQLR
jgi:antitoxin ParD1/3/4